MTRIAVLVYLLSMALPAAAGIHFRWIKDFPTRNHLVDVQFITDRLVVAVGFAGTVLRSADGGQTWEDVENNLRGDLLKVRFRDSLSGVAVEKGDRLYATRDGGRTWMLTEANNIAFNFIYGVRFIGDSTWVMVGREAIAVTRDWGRTFKYSAAIEPVEEFGKLTGLEVIDDSIWVVAGEHGLVARTTDGGKTWARSELGWGYDFNSIQQGPDGRLYLSHQGVNGDNPVYNAGAHFLSSDSGKTWDTLKTFNPLTMIKKAAYFSPRHAVGLGSDKRIYFSEDSGKSWTGKGDFRYAGMDFFPGIALSTGGTGFIAGYSGDLFRLADSGRTVTPMNRRQPDFDCVFFTTADTGFGTGSFPWINWPQGIHRTHDGGRTWIPAAAEDKRLYFARAFGKVDSRRLIVIGSRNGRDEVQVLATSDGGATWEERAPGRMSSPRFLDMVTQDLWYVGGDRFLLRTQNAGATWDSLPWIVGNGPMKSIHFVDPGLGFLVRASDNVSEAGRAFRTSDLGFNWDGVALPNLSELYNLRFFDRRLGFGVGRFAKGQDYYSVLRTEDGGATWTHLLKNDSRVFDLRDIAFAHPTTWLAVGRNGEMRYTEDGGATWVYYRKFSSDIVGIQFVTPHRGYLRGANGELVAVDIERDYPVPALRRPEPGGGAARLSLSGRVLRLETPVGFRSLVLEVSGLDGKRRARGVYAGENHADLDLRRLERGVYLIRARSDAWHLARKVVLE